MLKISQMKTYLYVFILAVGLGCARTGNDESLESAEPEEVTQTEYGIPVGDYVVKSGEIEKGDFFGTLLLRLGADNNQIQKLTDLGKDVFDVTKIKIGNSYEVFYTGGDSSRLLISYMNGTGVLMWFSDWKIPCMCALRKRKWVLRENMPR